MASLDSELRLRFLEANQEKVKAALRAAIGNGEAIEELVAILVNVADPFGRSLAMKLEVDVEGIIATGKAHGFVTVHSRDTVAAILGWLHHSLPAKLDESHPGKVWILVADRGNPELFSMGLESLAGAIGDA